MPKSKVSGILIRVTVGRSLKAATMPVAGAILVSLLVSVVIVRRRSRASASPEIHAQNASANCPERASAELESGLGARLAGSNPASSAVRILRCVTPTAKRPLLPNISSGHVRPTCGSLEGGSTMMSNDGGPQHTAGAQFADSIAVPGVAAVCKLRAGPAARASRTV